MPSDVAGNVHLIGTGKMARDVGLYFLSKGFACTWLSRSEARLGEVAPIVAKKAKRMAGLLGDPSMAERTAFLLLGVRPSSAPDVVFETTVEDVAIKRAVFDAVRRFCRDDTLRLTNSSAILPDALGHGVMGMHVFFPVSLTTFAELVFPHNVDARKRARLISLSQAVGLDTVAQSPKNAFWVNRLTLPLMAEVIRGIQAGVALDDIDDASTSSLLPQGQVSIMDAIGYDVLDTATAQYRARMPQPEADDLTALSHALARLVRAGYLGKKNRRPLLGGASKSIRDLVGDALVPAQPKDAPNLRETFHALFINQCLAFVSRRECTLSELNTALDAVFGAESPLLETLRAAGISKIRRTLETLYTATRISYFKPSRLLLDEARLKGLDDEG